MKDDNNPIIIFIRFILIIVVLYFIASWVGGFYQQDSLSETTNPNSQCTFGSDCW